MAGLRVSLLCTFLAGESDRCDQEAVFAVGAQVKTGSINVQEEPEETEGQSLDRAQDLCTGR